MEIGNLHLTQFERAFAEIFVLDSFGNVRENWTTSSITRRALASEASERFGWHPDYAMTATKRSGGLILTEEPGVDKHNQYCSLPDHVKEALSNWIGTAISGK